jgi:hypothetical protein
MTLPWRCTADIPYSHSLPKSNPSLNKSAADFSLAFFSTSPGLLSIAYAIARGKVRRFATLVESYNILVKNVDFALFVKTLLTALLLTFPQSFPTFPHPQKGFSTPRAENRPPNFRCFARFYTLSTEFSTITRPLVGLMLWKTHFWKGRKMSKTGTWQKSQNLSFGYKFRHVFRLFGVSAAAPRALSPRFFTIKSDGQTQEFSHFLFTNPPQSRII